MSLMMGSDGGVSAFPEGDNIFQWTGTIDGGKDTARAPPAPPQLAPRRPSPRRARFSGARRARLAHPPARPSSA